MPFYEYQCKNCGHELEAMQKVSDPALKKCPHCGKAQLQRLMSAPVFRLKGAGWYETDFKDDTDKKRNLADSPEASDSKDADKKVADTKTEAKVETKPDAKVESKAAGAPTDGAKLKASTSDGSRSNASGKKSERKKTNLQRHKRPVKKAPAKAKRRS